MALGFLITEAGYLELALALEGFFSRGAVARGDYFSSRVRCNGVAAVATLLPLGSVTEPGRRSEMLNLYAVGVQPHADVSHLAFPLKRDRAVRLDAAHWVGE